METRDGSGSLPAAPALGRTALSEWMDEQKLGDGPLSEFVPLAGGTQNVMASFTRAGRTYILRRGPRHLRPRSNQNILREITLLSALAGTAVPHARLIAACGDQAVLHGAVFYLMEPVAGFNAKVALPEPFRSAERDRWQMGAAMVDALATLGGVDYRQVGLTGFGKPEGFLERQVGRWLRELESFSRLPGYPGPGIEGIDQVASWLEANRPRDWRPGILHGDYHVANVMFAYDRPAVAAIVDWEMSTVGDPLLDLGTMLAIWPERDGAADLVGSALAQAGGLPNAAELVARYAARSDRDLTAIDWYVALACFRLGIILEGTHARALAGQADMTVGEQLHDHAAALFRRARRVASGGLRVSRHS
jgi:aminoglycoside phosphotransferase (APT) family kinase protein